MHPTRRDQEAEVAGRLGRGASVVVTGEAGIGKSTLVGHAVEATGRRAVTCRCFRSLGRAAAAPLQLGFAVPVPVGDELWTAQWVRARLGSRVLVVEDLQWADQLTLAVVTHLLPYVPVAVSIRLGDSGTAAALTATAAVEPIELDGLGADEAAALAQRLHPRLRPQEARALAERCGGNPLLIEQLEHPDGTRGLRSSTVARLRRCGPDAWRGFVMLVRAGEPLPATWVPGLDALAEARLTAQEDGQVRPRHALLAQVVAEHLAEEPGSVAALDRTVAQLAHDEGQLVLAARMYAAAGDHGPAYSSALAAAQASERPGERAELLRLAAVHATGDDAATIAADAVGALVQAGDYAAAAGLVDLFPERADALWCSLLGRIHWQTGADEAALAAFAAGLDAPPDGGPADVVLRAEYARVIALTGGDLARATALAREALALAEERDAEQPRAWGALGTVEYFEGLPAGLEHLRTAVELAAATHEPDLAVRFTLANNLSVALESAGDLDGAMAVAVRGAAQADELRLRGWAQQLTALAVNVSLHQGDYDTLLARGTAVLEAVAERRTIDQLEVSVGLGLIDLGRLEEARARLDHALAGCADDTFGRGSLTWVAAEERLWSGQYAEAARLADEAGELLGSAVRLFAVLTSALARVRGDLPLPEYEITDTELPVVRAVPHEVAGLRARSAGDPGARAHFAQAADLWAGHHRRGELRCRWLAADAAALDGPDASAARDELLELERLLAEQGWAPLLGAVRQSLRRRGVRSTAPRGRDGEVTLREREVLDLVSQGLSNDAIAVRLGLSPATVAAQIASARARLGLTTRWQAAAE